MTGSMTLGVLRGIPVRAHFTLGLAFAFLVLKLGPLGVPAGVALFVSVLLHELGHAVVAQRLGYRIAAIDLHLLGGAAQITEQPDDPRDELWIAAAGPAVSLLLAGAAAGLGFALGGPFTAAGTLGALGHLALVNLGMAVFNLLPALPMDGGRILRALLAHRLGELRGTEIAVLVARVLSVGLVVAGLAWGALGVGLIGVMVYALAGREQAMARAREAAREAARRAARARLPAFDWTARLGGVSERSG